MRRRSRRPRSRRTSRMKGGSLVGPPPGVYLKAVSDDAAVRNTKEHATLKGIETELNRLLISPKTDVSDEDKLIVFRARKIQKFMSQPFFVATQFTGFEGRYVSLEDSVAGFKAILDGDMDEYPENAFSYVGTIDDVVEKAKKAKE